MWFCVEWFCKHRMFAGKLSAKFWNVDLTEITINITLTDMIRNKAKMEKLREEIKLTSITERKSNWLGRVLDGLALSEMY